MEYQKTKKMLWTDIEISVISDDSNTEKIIDSVFEFFGLFEKEFSRFLPDSSLNLLNYNKKLEVSERFIDLISLSKRFYKKTGWYFNPLVNISNFWYSNSFDSGDFIKTETKTNIDFDLLKIEWKTVILEKNQNLDFWWIGKWYAVDLASQILLDLWYDDFFVNAWWDIYASGFYINGNGWIIGIENPFDLSLLATMNISNKAIATSGNYRRKWEIEWKKHHHIINPKTQNNDFQKVSVSIIADKTYEADALNKAIFNMDTLEAIKFMEKNGLSWIIISSSKKVFYTKDMISKYDLRFT
ncbi:MAG: hypothetical protein ACD_4C00077G0002 [uncultured bacterium (gcode 4)]|uniref:FAD:protein FMN transferase n=1 Tax=uncultured bacterium (gcode 4) TaxID=1234023 RepID=K2F7B8_9BACT|nr:MAG: hypothetical protein ACD_4C00077G0002 [uncultured bacterium (gcode 4)]